MSRWKLPLPTVLFAVATFGATAGEAHAYVTYSLWSRACPGAWVREYTGNTVADVNREYNRIRSWRPGRSWAMTTDYNGNRLPPSSNPCGSGGGGGGGGGGNGGGGGGGGGGGNRPPSCTGNFQYPVYQIYRPSTGSVYGSYCCQNTRQDAYMRNYIALRNAGYQYRTVYVSWNSCSSTAYTCSGGKVVAVANRPGGPGGWTCR